jgi:hypothetical protein
MLKTFLSVMELIEIHRHHHRKIAPVKLLWVSPLLIITLFVCSDTSITFVSSELLCDWRFTANLFFWVRSPLRPTNKILFFELNTYGYRPYLTPSLTRGWVCWSHQRSHSEVWVPWDSCPHFTVSDSRLPQPGVPGPHIYVPQERGGPVTLPGTGFFFIASNDSQGYGGGIRPRLHTDSHLCLIYGASLI